MSDRFRIPAWGPNWDPSPDDPGGYGLPPWWLRRRIPFPPWDPPDLREKLKELIRPEDVVALEHARVEAMRLELEAEMACVHAQMRAQMELVSQQLKVLEKYRG
jgi:hypothetical protein